MLITPLRNANMQIPGIDYVSARPQQGERLEWSSLLDTGLFFLDTERILEILTHAFKGSKFTSEAYNCNSQAASYFLTYHMCSNKYSHYDIELPIKDLILQAGRKRWFV